MFKSDDVIPDNVSELSYSSSATDTDNTLSVLEKDKADYSASFEPAKFTFDVWDQSEEYEILFDVPETTSLFKDANGTSGFLTIPSGPSDNKKGGREDKYNKQDYLLSDNDYLLSVPDPLAWFNFKPLSLSSLTLFISLQNTKWEA